MVKANIKADKIALDLQASDPSGAEGELIYNSTDNVIKSNEGNSRS